MNLAEFHFLRPEWFFALMPILALWMILRYRQGRGSSWEKSIDPSLLPFLLETSSSKNSVLGQTLVLIGSLLAVISLAGPVWQQTPQPVHERENALVIVLDLSRSMYATDVKPNRLIRARRKLLDLLDARVEGVTGLIVYAGDEHLVSPLTDDAKTIAELVPAVSPQIMPVRGSQLAPALEMAHQLFSDAGIASGRILILTDEIRDIARAQAVARSHRNAYPISVLAVGTLDGAPILDPQEGYLRNSSGELIVPKVDTTTLSEFASIAGGRFTPMTLLDTDLDYLLAEQPLEPDESFRETDRDFDVWYEEGPWLLLLLLPIAALGFRRGWLWQIAAVAILIQPQDVYASLWDDLWWNGNQQGKKLLESGAPSQAASKFTDPAWKATAQYRAGDFEAAAAQYSELENADGQHNLHYNHGNALAKSGKYEAAIDAYDKALGFDAEHEDAIFNKRLVEELLKKQEQQQQEGEGDDQQNNDDQSNNDSNDSQDSNSDEEQQADNGESSEEQEAEAQDAEEQNEAQADEEQQQEQEATDQQFSESDTEPLSEEEQQALQQWLRKVPDDPGGLLRRKFEMQYQEKLKRGEIQENDASGW